MNRPANVVTGTQSDGVNLLVSGSEYGVIDLDVPGQSGYQLGNSVDLLAVSDLNIGDIEIRGLWVDGIDNLVFAASSGGSGKNPAGGGFPTFFVLQIQ